MQDYFIRGQVFISDHLQENGTCQPFSATTPPFTTSPSNPPYQPLTESGLRIEVWDKDIRFNDRLGSGKTDSRGFFEIEFTDEDFQQDFLDLDRDPDIFFQVFQGRQLLFNTFIHEESVVTIPWNFPNRLPILVGPHQEKVGNTCYVIQVQVATTNLRPIKERPDQANFQEAEVRVIDVLPTLDQINRSGTPTSFTSLDSKGGSLQQIVDNALSDVLGRNLKSDPKAFLSTLTQSFTAKESNGRTEYIWTPRAYAAMQNELGGTVSGAQASLYHRAKTALNDALPLLEKLYPLDPAADQQNMEAMRAIVRTELVELVDELGATGGPRVQRVDSLFQLLLGSADDINSTESIGGQLKNLADVFGLNRDRINTVDEEQNYGNFLIIRDYLVSLRFSWNEYVQDSGGGAFVGTQLVLLSQALSVVAESVQEVYRIMDLVFFGPAERQAVLIDFTQVKSPEGMPFGVSFPLPDGTGYPVNQISKLVPPMSVEGLLMWAWRFGAEEGPALAKAGGKLGIAKAIAQTADKLMILVQAASFTPVRNTAFLREGVLRSLRDLAFQLYQVKRLAQEIIPPATNYQPDDLEPFPTRTIRFSQDSLQGSTRLQ